MQLHTIKNNNKLEFKMSGMECYKIKIVCDFHLYTMPHSSERKQRIIEIILLIIDKFSKFVKNLNSLSYVRK